jgi:hypothetical protein
MILQDSVIYHTRAPGPAQAGRLLDGCGDVSHIVLSSQALQLLMHV